MKRRHRILAATAVLDGLVVALTAPNLGAGANILLILLMIKSAVFVLLYGLRSNWRSTAPGRAVMALIACIAIITGLGMLNLFLGDYVGRAVVRLIAFTAVGLTLMNLLLTLIDAQRDDGNPDR